jgi:hypothetical protein
MGLIQIPMPAWSKIVDANSRQKSR